jgi:hypothetical protein
MDTKATGDIPFIPGDILLTLVRRAMNIRAMLATPLPPVRETMDHSAIWDALLTLVSSLTGIRTARFILPTRVPVMTIPRMDTLAIAPRRTGRLGPAMVSSLLAEA